MMRQLAFATAAAAMIAGLGAGTASADDARRWSPQNHHQTERREEVRRRAPATEVVSVGLHRRYRNEAIPLRRLLNLDRDYRGYRIQSVVVKVRPNKSRGRLALLANGHVVDRERAHHGRRIVLRPNDGRLLGSDVNRLQLAVRGRAYIDSVQVKLQAPRHDRGRRPVYRSKHDPRTGTPDLAEQVVRIILEQIEVADGRY